MSKPIFDNPSKCLMELWELQNNHHKNIHFCVVNGIQDTQFMRDETTKLIALLQTFSTMCQIEHNTDSYYVIKYYREHGWYDFPVIYITHQSQ